MLLAILGSAPSTVVTQFYICQVASNTEHVLEIKKRAKISIPLRRRYLISLVFPCDAAMDNGVLPIQFLQLISQPEIQLYHNFFRVHGTV